MPTAKLNRAQRERFANDVFKMLDAACSVELADDEAFLVGYPADWPDFREVVADMVRWRDALEADLTENP